MNRVIRYQAAILRERQILLIQHREHGGRSYWLLPGGGREDGETEEECVLREVREETGLDVQIVKLVLDTPEPPGGSYRRHKTYWCIPIAGEARPGYEPEPEVAAIYAIAAVRWLDLNDESTWGEEITRDRFTYPELKAIQEAFQTTNP